ncbi:MAG: hypothetical protein A2939_02665 [Parcubacteria group bacterium RIFCSPLOWO2_01_FULL_48_18]|nr:MAG: hypothetical protein A2939_02665 [Parcubacteria group bacterium RIFCSPLOWO2_01_FULL_48_18]OHB22990.1 MAG: hypothetical protein A3J67_03800 [Parcubacteria group bacterium RIFCSPHIGHO2_02_FULL_48_10b]
MKTKIIKPPHLRNGDTVAVVTVSYPILNKNLFERGVKTLERLGLRVVYYKEIFKSYGQHMAGMPRDRIIQFHKAIANKKVKAVFNLVGGYAANQILDVLDFSLIRRNPKIIYGFSDVTTILNPIFEKTGLITFHGPNIEEWFYRLDRYSRNSLVTTLFEPRPTYEIPRSTRWKVFKPGRARGRLAGGNLTIVRNLVGTDFNLRWKNRLFFWEEIGEDIEGIDNILTHLKLAGALDDIAGMIIGKNIIAPPESYLLKKRRRALTFYEVVTNVLRGYTFPVVSDVDFGHLLPQATIPIGARAELNASSGSGRIRIKILESVVS